MFPASPVPGTALMFLRSVPNVLRTLGTDLKSDKTMALRIYEAMSDAVINDGRAITTEYRIFLLIRSLYESKNYNGSPSVCGSANQTLQTATGS